MIIQNTNILDMAHIEDSTSINYRTDTNNLNIIYIHIIKAQSGKQWQQLPIQTADHNHK